jgi:hypothetical protein
VKAKKPRPDDPEPESRPPGDFTDEEHAQDTARFLAEVKRMAERRAHADDQRETWERG